MTHIDCILCGNSPDTEIDVHGQRAWICHRCNMIFVDDLWQPYTLWRDEHPPEKTETDTDVLLRIHNILFGPQAIAKDEVKLYTEVAMVMIGWAQTYFSKEGSK